MTNPAIKDDELQIIRAIGDQVAPISLKVTSSGESARVLHEFIKSEIRGFELAAEHVPGAARFVQTLRANGLDDIGLAGAANRADIAIESSPVIPLVPSKSRAAKPASPAP